MGSGFDDWIYWHVFAVTIVYNSSHIELLQNYELRLLSEECSEESLEFMNEPSFTTAREPNMDHRLQRFHYCSS
jgi:hypothetical protein